MAGNRVIFSAAVVRYHVRFLWAQTKELKKRGYKLFQLLVTGRLVLVYRWIEHLRVKHHKSFHSTTNFFHLSPVGKKQAHVPCVFKETRVVSYLCEENKVSSYKRWWYFNIFWNLKWTRINVKLWTKIWKMSWQKAIVTYLWIFKWKYIRETYTLLRLCLIVSSRGKVLGTKTNREWSGQGWGAVCLMYQATTLHCALSEIVSLVDFLKFKDWAVYWKRVSLLG